MIDELEQPTGQPLEQRDLCFSGDTSPIDPAARLIAVRLKRGALIDAFKEPDEYARLVAARTGVEESLNADFLTLHVSERHRVAWAECVPSERIDDSIYDGVRSLIKRPKFGRNDAALFFVLEHMLRMRQAEGYEKVADWLVTEAECREAWLEVLGESLSSNASNAGSAWESVLKRAQGDSFRWLEPHGSEERGVLRITPVVPALVDAGFCSGFIARVEGRMAMEDAERGDG